MPRRLKTRTVNGCRVRRLPSGAMEVERELRRPLGPAGRAAVRRWCGSAAIIGRELVRFYCAATEVQRATGLLATVIETTGADVARVVEPERIEARTDIAAARRAREAARSIPPRDADDTDALYRTYHYVVAHPGVTASTVAGALRIPPDRVARAVDTLIHLRLLDVEQDSMVSLPGSVTDALNGRRQA